MSSIRFLTQNPEIVNDMGTSSSEATSEKVVRNPEKDDIEVDLEFYDETMEGIEGVSMPDPDENE
jgi:hypothetical protein